VPAHKPLTGSSLPIVLVVTMTASPSELAAKHDESQPVTILIIGVVLIWSAEFERK
jgi:hypothetical protein